MGKPKTETSAGDVPLHSILAAELFTWQRITPYAKDTDWIFASARLKGRRPRVANMLAEKHLRPAAVQAGVLIKDDPRKFGFHAFRHAFSSFLIAGRKTDVRCVQDLLRHADAHMTLNTYSHSTNEDRLIAQGHVLAELLPVKTQVTAKTDDDAKLLKIVVARDGVEPPTPAFSGLRSTT